MRTLNIPPMCRQGDSGPVFEDIQHLLNQRDDDTWSKTELLVEDAKFGPLTAAKVREFQRSAALSPDGIVGPQTRAWLFAPQADRVDQAQNTAQTWTLLAKAAVRSLQSWVQALQFDGPSPGGNIGVCVDAFRVHFHIDLPKPAPGGGTMGGSTGPLDWIDADTRLAFILQVFEDVDFVLSKASIREGRVFYSVGPKQCQELGIGLISAGNRLVTSRQGSVHLIVFPPSFAVTTNPEVFRTLNQQASTVLHECCHYVRPPAEGAQRNVTDFAYGLPAFAGQPNKKLSTHNYQQLTPDEALHNAESYNLFAEHVDRKSV